MNTETLDATLSILAPTIVERIQAAEPLEIRNHNTEINGSPLYSAKDPKRQAQAWARKWPTHGWAYVVPGLGLGHHIQALLDRIEPDASVVVIERDFRLIRAAFSRYDWTEHMKSGRFLILDRKSVV